MSLSKRRYEGYLLIDHRAGGGKLYETATITCSHCQTVVQLNQDRSRERGYCRKCDHYICDRCATVLALTRECVTFRQVLDEAQERAERNIILLR